MKKINTINTINENMKAIIKKYYELKGGNAEAMRSEIMGVLRAGIGVTVDFERLLIKCGTLEYTSEGPRGRIAIDGQEIQARNIKLEHEAGMLPAVTVELLIL